MRFMQIESVLQTKNRSEPAKIRFSVALDMKINTITVNINTEHVSRSTTKPTKWPVRPEKPRTSLGIHPSDQSLRCLHEETLGP